jgi:hypothetical protein
MLFKPEDIVLPEKKEPDTGDPKAAEKRIPPQVHMLGAKGRRARKWTIDDVKMETVRQALADFKPGDLCHIVGANHWNTHDMIEALLDHTDGPAALWFTVYSISDNAVRRLSAMVDAGKITTVHALINNHMARQRATGSQQLLQLAEDMMIYPVHAKVYVLRSKTRGITVCSSANMTACPWLEAATVTEDPELADWTIDWIRKALALSEPFSADRMSESVRKSVLHHRDQMQR